RETHTPALFHVEEITQPQGHSTSGSHERYKSHERLQWEKEWDCIKKFREWILANGLASEDEMSDIEIAAKEYVRASRARAWEEYVAPIKKQVERVVNYLNLTAKNHPSNAAQLNKLAKDLQGNREPLR